MQHFTSGANRVLVLAAAILLVACNRADKAAPARSTDSTSTASSAASCAANNGGLSLPEGFCATIFADSLGHVRHLVVAGNGTLYANT